MSSDFSLNCLILRVWVMLLGTGLASVLAVEPHPPVLNPAAGLVHSPALVDVSQNHPSGTVFYTLDGPDPQDPFGGVSPQARGVWGSISINSTVIVRARVRAGKEWSPLTTGVFAADQDFSKLVFTELMYHPRDSDDLAEFIELKNTGSLPLDMQGLKLGVGLDALFPPEASIAPGGFWVMIRDAQAYRALHPSGRIDGFYNRGLDNGWERLAVQSLSGATAADFIYDTAAPWQVVPDNHGYFPQDGVGFSLVRRDPASFQNPADYRTWRASARRYGSPGADDPVPDVMPVYINELLTRGSNGMEDFVEFYNPHGVPVDLGGWFLSDERNMPFRYTIPPGTIVPAGGYLVLKESQYGAGVSFSGEGERCYLFSADGAGLLTGYSHGLQYGGSERGTGFGRHLASDGSEDFPLQLHSTPGAANAGPRIPPVVINEIMYRPSKPGDHYIELHNTTDTAIQLWDPENPGSSWAVGTDITGFRPLPEDTTISAHGYLLLVNTNPLEFRGTYRVPAEVPIIQLPTLLVNPYQPREVWLFQPSGLAGGLIRYLPVEHVLCLGEAPWPAGADASGHSLERINPRRYANDPKNWRDSPEINSPGRANTGNLPPRVWAGGPQTCYTAREATLPGVVADEEWDGPPPAVAWSQVSGPAPIAFMDQGQAAVRARFPLAGQYVVRLTASDGLLTASDSAVIDVEGGAFEAWRSLYLSPAGPGGEPGADPDGDGLPNEGEYIFASNPRIPGPANPLRLTFSQGRWQATWGQLANVQDFIVTPESAASLEGPWLGRAEFFERTEIPMGTLKQVTIREKYPVPGRKGGYVRLRYRLK